MVSVDPLFTVIIADTLTRHAYKVSTALPSQHGDHTLAILPTIFWIRSPRLGCHRRRIAWTSRLPMGTRLLTRNYPGIHKSVVILLTWMGAVWWLWERFAYSKTADEFVENIHSTSFDRTTRILNLIMWLFKNQHEIHARLGSCHICFVLPFLHEGDSHASFSTSSMKSSSLSPSAADGTTDELKPSSANTGACWEADEVPSSP